MLGLSTRELGVLRYADIELDLNRFKVRRNGKFVPLSAMQIRLLRHFLENPEIVFTRKELLQSVWQNDEIDDGAVTACVSRMRSALNAVGGPDLIRSVSRIGYALDAEAGKPRAGKPPQRTRRLADSSPPRNGSVTSHS